MAYARQQAVEFTRFTYFFAIGLLTREPKPVEPFLKIFAPLDTNVWLAFGVTLIVSSLSLVLILRCLPFEGKGSVQSSLIQEVKRKRSSEAVKR